MEYILSGDPKYIGIILQENRIRVRRGVIKFTPLVTVDSGDDKKTADSDDSKDVVFTDDKKPKIRKRTKKSE